MAKKNAPKKASRSARKITALTVLPVQLLDTTSSIVQQLLTQLPERPASQPEKDLLRAGRVFLNDLAIRRRLGSLVTIPQQLIEDQTAANAEALLALLGSGGSTSSFQGGSSSSSSSSTPPPPPPAPPFKDQ